ncbi:hypothetical protein BDZ97DRAFT_1914451 [Flammula alnicola]|nr:hypothetical protein BDZ97DRAFT_1914451 [Flammula alnicola]
MSSSKLVAFILGAGTHVGAAVAANLRAKGYKVALGSRNPAQVGADSEDYFHVKVDVSKREAIEAAFDTVVNKLGPVNVVVYNAASLDIPPTPTEVLSLSAEKYYESAAVGLGAFTAAQKALSGFRAVVHRDHPKVFIATGNGLPFNQFAPSQYFTLGIQKALETRFIATAVKSYEAENIQFYFATLVSTEGGVPGPDIFAKSALTHAQVYWELISNEKQANWDHRFTIDGATYPHSN